MCIFLVTDNEVDKHFIILNDLFVRMHSWMMKSTVLENGMDDYICTCMLVEMGNTSAHCFLQYHMNLVVYPGITYRVPYLHVIELCLVLVWGKPWL